MSTVVIEYSHENLVRDLRRAAMGLAMFMGITMLAHCGTGCLPASEPQTAREEYENAIIACAATAGYPGAYDHESDMLCRAGVDCRFGLGPC